MKQYYLSVSRFVFIFCLLLMGRSALAQSNKGDRLLGTYRVVEMETKEESKVKITKAANGTYQGQVIWLASPKTKDGKLKCDIYNPDPKKRSTPGNKIMLMWNFTYDAAKDTWVGGEIYDPCHGKIYKCRLNFETPTKLKVRGYIGVPALGKSMFWYKLD